MQNSGKIRILFVHSRLDIGGAEKLRLYAVRYLDKKRYDIKICCIERKGVIGEEIERLGLKVDCLNMSPKPYNLPATAALFLYIRKHKFDIVQSSLFNANFHGRLAAFFARVPIIISEEHSEHYLYTSLKHRPYILIDRLLSMVTDSIICCSEKMLFSIKETENILPEKLLLISNCIDPSGLVPGKAKKYILNELGLRDCDIIIGNIASIAVKKGHEYLLRAFPRVLDIYPDARLVIAGGGVESLKKEFVKLAEDLKISKQTYFLGEREDIADLLSIFDIFVLPSIKEGMPIALLEAMYFDIPVIATDVGGVSEIVSDGETGILVAPMDTAALADAIIGLIKDREKGRYLSFNAKNALKDYFSPGRYVADMEKVYNRLLTRKYSRSN